MTTPEASMPFDKVKAAGDHLTVEGFLALPLPTRVKYILSDSLQFSLDGEPVEKTTALQSLRTQRAAGSTPSP
jgi:hypothetical protein